MANLPIATELQYKSAPSAALEDELALRHAFDHAAWVRAFRQATRDHDTARQAFLRNIVTKSSAKALAQGGYIEPESGKLVQFQDVSASVRATSLHHKAEPVEKHKRKNTTAHFVNADALEVALFLQERKGINPVLLVLADPIVPGGQLGRSTCAQEQSIYRRTTLMHNVADPEGLAGPQRMWKYNVPDYGVLYAPEVQVFRNSEARGYELFSELRRVSMLLASSVVHPHLVTKKGEARLSAADEAAMRRKIEALLSVALAKGHDSIVLSAFGCGYNGCPPHHVAQLFREVLKSKAFDKAFHNVTFGIVDDENTRKAHNPKGNLKPFEDVFLGK